MTPFWKRKNLYRENGKCCYIDLCGKEDCELNPEECPIWDAAYDGECQGDDTLLDS